MEKNKWLVFIEQLFVDFSTNAFRMSKEYQLNGNLSSIITFLKKNEKRVVRVSTIRKLEKAFNIKIDYHDINNLTYKRLNPNDESRKNNSTKYLQSTIETSINENSKKLKAGKLSSDLILIDLVKKSNDGVFTISITLTVRGAILTGYLIGVKQYCEEYGKLFAGAFLDDPEINKKEIIEKYSRFGSDLYEIQEKDHPHFSIKDYSSEKGSNNSFSENYLAI